MGSIKANKCPECGGRIYVSEHYASTHDYRVLKNGELGRRFKKSNEGPIGCFTAFCESCYKTWDSEEMLFDGDTVRLKVRRQSEED